MARNVGKFFFCPPFEVVSTKEKESKSFPFIFKTRDPSLGLFSPMATMPNNGKLSLLFFFLLIVALGFVLKICCLIYKKFHYNFEPVHVFILNYFGTLALHMFSAQITILLVIFPASEEVCW